MGCCDSCIKYLLFIFNLIFVLSGLAILVVGSVLLANSSDVQELLNDIGEGLVAPQIVLIVVGCVIFFIAFLGCCGAIRESRCMLISFAVLLLTIFIVELVIGIYAVTNFTSVETQINKTVGNAFENQFNDAERMKVFGALERTMECCGDDGYKSYKDLGRDIPDTCCQDFEDKCAATQDLAKFWQQGCKRGLIDFLEDSGKIIGGVAIGLSVIEIVGAIFALRQASTMRG